MKENKTIFEIQQPKAVLIGGLVFSTLVILVRAFQKNAEPMSDWSIFSWILILAPVLYPWYIYIGCWIFKLTGMILLGIISWIYEGSKKLINKISNWMFEDFNI